jgi:hypothetical protein
MATYTFGTATHGTTSDKLSVHKVTLVLRDQLDLQALREHKVLLDLQALRVRLVLLALQVLQVRQVQLVLRAN